MTVLPHRCQRRAARTAVFRDLDKGSFEDPGVVAELHGILGARLDSRLKCEEGRQRWSIRIRQPVLFCLQLTLAQRHRERLLGVFSRLMQLCDRLLERDRCAFDETTDPHMRMFPGEDILSRETPDVLFTQELGGTRTRIRQTEPRTNHLAAVRPQPRGRCIQSTLGKIQAGTLHRKCIAGLLDRML